MEILETPADVLCSGAGISDKHRNYLAGALQGGIPSLIRNAIDTRLEILRDGDHLVPVVVNDGTARDCYSISSHAHYIRYMREELGRMSTTGLTLAADAVLGLTGLLGRATGFNRCVSVNNWLFSTNPTVRPDLFRITPFLVDRFPTHALVYRNVTAAEVAGWKESVPPGWILLENRPVHVWRARDWDSLGPRRRHKIRRDIRELKESRLSVTGVQIGEADRLAHLYRKLYIEKYSALNADFSASFFRLLLASFFRFSALRSEDGEILAFAGLFDDAEMTVVSTVGYDTDMDVKLHGLYRKLMAVCFEEALQRNSTLFLSTGASKFKSHRGSSEEIEYEAVYAAHLPWYRDLPWDVIRLLFRYSVPRFDTSQL